MVRMSRKRLREAYVSTYSRVQRKISTRGAVHLQIMRISGDHRVGITLSQRKDTICFESEKRRAHSFPQSLINNAEHADLQHKEGSL